MKEYRLTLTVNVFVFADDEDEAQDKLDNLDIGFYDPNNGDELQVDLIDTEISDVTEV